MGLTGFYWRAPAITYELVLPADGVVAQRGLPGSRAAQWDNGWLAPWSSRLSDDSLFIESCRTARRTTVMTKTTKPQAALPLC